MNTGQRNVVGMLAVVAVLLGLNLVVGRASAQTEPEIRSLLSPILNARSDPPPPKPIDMAATSISSTSNQPRWMVVIRLWSDGVVEHASVQINGPTVHDWAQSVLPPPPTPSAKPISIAIASNDCRTKGGGGEWCTGQKAYVQWSDGTVMSGFLSHQTVGGWTVWP